MISYVAVNDRLICGYSGSVCGWNVLVQFFVPKGREAFVFSNNFIFRWSFNELLITHANVSQNKFTRANIQLKYTYTLSSRQNIVMETSTYC